MRNGDGSTVQRLVPTAVSGLATGITSIAAGDFHTGAVTAPGGGKAWGWNTTGQLGDGSTINRVTPVDVVGLGQGTTR